MLITEQYRSEQAALHAVGNYGTASLQYGSTVQALLRATGAQSILDYGCGSKRSLLRVLELSPPTLYEGYDPAIPTFAARPMPAELVCCIDVLEHIEPDLLDNVLDHLSELCDPHGFFTVHTGPAVKVLSDGRNAHLTQQGIEWWLPRFVQRFDIVITRAIPNGFALVVKSRHSSNTLPVPQEIVLPQFGGGTSAALRRTPSVGTLPSVPVSASPSALQPQSQPISDDEPARLALKLDGHRIAYVTPDQSTFDRVQAMVNGAPGTVRWLRGMARGAVLLDVGANVGTFAVLAAVLREARVFAVESSDQDRALLVANIQANKLSESVIDIADDAAPTSIDRFVDEGALPVPDYIRLDAQLPIHIVLAGAERTLSDPKVKQLMLELDPRVPEHQDVMQWLKSKGFVHYQSPSPGASKHAGAEPLVFSRQTAAGADRAFERKFVIAMPPTAKGRFVLQHMMKRLAVAEVVSHPFPYTVVDDVFPGDYYQEMLANFPSPDGLRSIADTGRVTRGNYKERSVILFNDQDFARLSSAQQAFWHDLAGWMYSDLFMNMFVLKFQTALERRLAQILDKQASLKVRGDALLVNDQTNFAIGPHTDAPHRLVTLLFYLPRDAGMRELGTSIYRPWDREFVCWGGSHHAHEDFELVKTVEFLPNRLFTFPKTERTFHGVEPIHRSDVNRPLLINNVRLLNAVTH